MDVPPITFPRPPRGVQPGCLVPTIGSPIPSPQASGSVTLEHFELLHISLEGISRPQLAVAVENRGTSSTCDYRLLNPDDRMCEYGRDNIRLSRAFDGSGARVRRMLEKALRGEHIGIGVRRSLSL